MDKVSHIVPASTRQVWASGETDKPRRVTELNAEDRAQGGASRVSESIPALSTKQEQAVVARDPLRGGHLNTMA